MESQARRPQQVPDFLPRCARHDREINGIAFIGDSDFSIEPIVAIPTRLPRRS